MNCPLEAGNEGILLEYAAGKLNADARTQMERHMESCRACSEFAGGQQAVWQALADWEPAEVSLDFDRRLYARIEQQETSWWARVLRRLNPLMRYSVPVGATAGVIILAGLLLNRPAVVQPVMTTQSAQVESLQADQVQSAVDEMEMLRQFNQLVPDNDSPKM